MVKLVSVNVMDCVSVVLSNSFGKSQCNVAQYFFFFLEFGIHTVKHFFLHLHNGYVLLFSSFIIISFFLPSVQACRERIKGLQSKITAFSQRMNLINQRGTPDTEEMTV